MLPRSRTDEKSEKYDRRSTGGAMTPRPESRSGGTRRDRDQKKRRETTSGIEVLWNRPGTSKQSRLGPRPSSDFNADFFEQAKPTGQAAGQSVQGDQAAVMPDPPAVRPQPDGLSDENESEWDEMSVLETFARNGFKIRSKVSQGHIESIT